MSKLRKAKGATTVEFALALTVFLTFLLGITDFSRMLFNYAILGFALTEAIGLFALMLAFLMLFS